MGLPKNILREHPYLERDTILVGWRGSIAHGMYVPNNEPDSIDDKDVMAIVVPDLSYYYGMNEWGSRGTKEHFIDEWDIVSYEVRKTMRLLRKGNPNVLCMLWLDDNYYLKRTAAGNLLIDNRDLFWSRLIYHSFVGYAHGQLHRMEHYKFEGYMGEKRKTLVQKYGYDTKNASHLIRLLRMGIEYLRERVLHVTRSDVTQLLDIKKGRWTLEQVKTEADRLFRRIENVYDTIVMPKEPDRDKLNELCIAIVQEALKCQ